MHCDCEYLKRVTKILRSLLYLKTQQWQQYYIEIKSNTFFLSYTLGLCYANRPTLWHIYGGLFEWGVLRRCGWVLTFRKNISLGFWDFNICNFTDLINAQTACNTPKTKEHMKSLHMTPLITSRLNHWCHMDYFNNVLTSLGLEEGVALLSMQSESHKLMSYCEYEIKLKNECCFRCR